MQKSNGVFTEFKANLALIEAQNAFLALKKRFDELGEEVKALEVVNDETCEKASEMLVMIKKCEKKLDEERKKRIAIPNQFVRKVNARAKEFLNPLLKLERDLKAKIRDYKIRLELERREMEKKAEEERKRLQEQLDKEAKEKGIEPVKLPEIAMPKEKLKVNTDNGTVYEKKRWTFKIVDFEKIPREYLMVDSKRVNAAIRAGVREIPGIEIYQEVEIATRRI